MVKCCVDTCRGNSKNSSPDVTYHRFPDVRCFPNLYKRWIHKITGVPEGGAVDFVAENTSRVCSLHFTEDDFVVKTDRNRTRRTLRVEAQPSQRLPLVREDATADPFAMKLRNYTIASLRNDSAVCKINNVPSSQSKRTLAGHDLTITKVKKIKVEPLAFISRNRQSEGNCRPEECTNSSQPSYPIPKTESNDANIPSCYRVRKDVYSPYAFSIAELEPELGFSVLMVNDNKYLKFNPVQDDKQTWRCIIKTCYACVVTSSVHWSIVVGCRGVHYHLPTKGVPLDPFCWAPGTPGTPWMVEPEDEGPQSVAASWSPDVGGDSGCEQSPAESAASPWRTQALTSPPELLPLSRFNVRDLPNTSHFQVPSSQQPPMLAYPAFSSLEALSKFCCGQVVEGNPFGGPWSTVYDRTVEMNVVAGSYPLTMSSVVSPESLPVIIDSRSLAPDEQAGYIPPSPASEQNISSADVNSEGSTSGSSSTPREEPVYQDIGEVSNGNQKDPLALQENVPDTNESLKSRRAGLKREDAAFFQTLGDYLTLLTDQDKEFFKERVIDVISQMCRYSGSQQNGAVQES